MSEAADDYADLDGSPEMTVTDPEMRALLGMLDVPAFARRGAEVEQGLAAARARCRRERLDLLEMVALRLKQWSAVAVGPGDFRPPLAGPVAPLWALAGLPDPERWARSQGTPGRRRAVATDLIASVERFNRRWLKFVEGLELSGLNRAIDKYNRYYVIEKEIILGSHRLASRHFEPIAPLTHADLLAEFPPLPVPAIVRR